VVTQQTPTRSAAATLSRVITLASRAAHTARVLARVSGSIVVAVWLVCAFVARPDAATEWLSRGFLLAAALVPALVLMLFSSGIHDLRELPQRYRKMGVDIRSRMGQLGAHDSQQQRGILGPLIGLARAAIGARDLVSPLTFATAALRPTILLGALAAAMIALLEVPAAGVILVLVLL
jgi:hypothetical protein